MKNRILLISDTHFNPDNIPTYCDRPDNYTDKIIKNWKRIADINSTTIHLGDVIIGDRRKTKNILDSIPGRKILIRGNHDVDKSLQWWMNNGFDFACDSMIYNKIWLTHKPSNYLPPDAILNIFGHLHNIWNGFHPPTENGKNIIKLEYEWQRLFALEYTNYCPIELNSFIDNPNKHQSKGAI